jgi:hypothetical protein
MDDSWANIFTDTEARTAEYSDTDSNDSDFTPRTEYDAVDKSEEEDEAGPAIQHHWHNDSLSSERMIVLEIYVGGYKYLQGLMVEM